MAQANLDVAFEDFWNDLHLEAEASSEPLASAFFRLFGDLAAENGDCSDLQYTPVRREGRGGYQLDGFAIDVDRGELCLTACDFRQEPRLETLNAGDMETLVQRVRAFFELSLQQSFVSGLEEASPAFEAAWPIFEHQAQVRRIRILVLTNAKLSIRKRPEGASDLAGRPVVQSILDFTRYNDILGSHGAVEPIEVDVAELYGEPLPCLAAHGSTTKYESYLVAIPGGLLAKIYGLYGARLLERNVRSFLQAKTKVNRRIISTLTDHPEMFFAYNNGLTATASGVTTSSLPGSGIGITAIDNLQIVNGGQTTASILYAKDNAKADLSDVWVQMKLSVVRPELVDEIVPNISRFANTQNKVSEADFFSNHPFHVAMENISRRLPAPPKPGSLVGSKWFYERARGQYKYSKAYGTPSERRKFEIEFPKDQVVEKTDLAKFILTFDCKPHVVSRGAQKCFLEFAEQVSEVWVKNEASINESFFKAAIAKAMVFRRLDHTVGLSDWYQSNRGFKAPIVTYSIAWLVDHLRTREQSEIDLARIWNEQDVPEVISSSLSEIASQVAVTINAAPSHLKNVGEYVKHPSCWSAVQRSPYEFTSRLQKVTTSLDDARTSRADGIRAHNLDQEIQFETTLLRIPAAREQIEKFARLKGFLSPKSNAALSKLARSPTSLTPSEKKALKYLLDRMSQAGFDVSAI